MTSYAQILLSSSNSWSSAYLQYTTGYKREGYAAYAFVEDDDDKSYYQIALSQYDRICYLGCGGKSGVIAVFNKLKTENCVDGNLFFVDRDTEEDPLDVEEILRTEMYSWESYICTDAYVGWFLQRKLEPNLRAGEVEEVKAKWLASVSNFDDALTKHTALCRTAFVINKSLGMSDVRLFANAHAVNSIIYPGPDAASWYEEKVALVVQMGYHRDDISRRVERYLPLNKIKVSKGKLIFQLLRIFSTQVAKTLGRTFRGNYNSAKIWLDQMPWTNSNLEYIRVYAEHRINRT